MAKKGCLAVLAALAITGAVHAQITISGGFALSYMSGDVSGGGASGTVDGNVGFGGNVYLDYLLPISIPLSVGVEVGVDNASIDAVGITGTAIPLLLRVAYHFDLMSQLDLYAVGKIGGAIGILSSSGLGSETGGGVGVGIDIGVAYYFTHIFGLFAEGGFDGYFVSKEYEGGVTLKTPFYRFFTIGLSVKF